MRRNYDTYRITCIKQLTKIDILVCIVSEVALSVATQLFIQPVASKSCSPMYIREK